MRINVLVFLFSLCVESALSQTNTTRIYFVKNGAQTAGATALYTTLNTNTPIKVKNNGYVLVETDADSIGFFKRNSNAGYGEDNSLPAPKLKPIFVKFERGKSYFFKIGPLVYSQHLDISEMTETAFWMYVGLNGLDAHTKKYMLSVASGLQELTPSDTGSY